MKNRFCKVSKLLAILAVGIAVLAAGKAEVRAGILEDTGLGTAKDERTILEDVDSASDISYNLTRSVHLAYGYSQVDRAGYNRAGITGTTQCHHDCQHVYLSIAVDKMDPETEEVEQIRLFEYEDENVGYLTKALEIIVPKNYYYSLRGYHSCLHDGVRETTTTLTDWLYIGTTTKPVEPHD